MQRITIEVNIKNKDEKSQLIYISDDTIYFRLPAECTINWDREKLKKAISKLENKNAAATKEWVFELILSETDKKTSEDLGDLLNHVNRYYDINPVTQSTLEDGVNFICGSMFDADIKAEIKTELE